MDTFVMGFSCSLSFEQGSLHPYHHVLHEQMLLSFLHGLNLSYLIYLFDIIVDIYSGTDFPKRSHTQCSANTPIC